jgi:hypothetical protein
MAATPVHRLLLGGSGVSGPTNMAENNGHLQGGAAATGHDGLG